MKKISILLIMYLCTTSLLKPADPKLQNFEQATRNNYVHHNQLRQQFLNITGPEYNGDTMNLGALYAANIDNNLATLSTLVNSPTMGNVALGDIVYDPSYGNAALALLMQQLQTYVRIAGSSLTTMTITQTNTSGLVSISSDGTITFNVNGTYLITGSLLGATDENIISIILADGFNGTGGPFQVSIFNINTFGTTNRLPVCMPYSVIYNVVAGNIIQFYLESWTASDIKLMILRLA